MSICACAQPDELVGSRFSLHRPGARAVFLAFFVTRAEDAPDPEAGFPLPGCYDGYPAPIVNDLQRMASTPSGTWQLDIPLRPGWYKYAFLVDGTWVQDPNASHVFADGAGGEISARTIVRPETIRFPIPPKLVHRRQPALRRAV